MAIAGGATTAYWVSIVSGKVRIVRTTAASSICVKPAQAVTAALDGETVTVAGADMWALQQAFAARGIEVAT